ncbi:MAG TPA: hypothetical protein VFF94_09865, partial [Novosphingobium sp.]|nr:hypothetical protein [Novosphingobium sp.]
APAARAATDQPVCAAADTVIYRVSELKPGGSLAGFAKAVADHIKWYADHGYTADVFSWGQVVDYDQASHTGKLSPTRVFTLHQHAAGVPHAQQDAGWAAFVSEYDANSNMVSMQLLCTAH